MNQTLKVRSSTYRELADASGEVAWACAREGVVAVHACCVVAARIAVALVNVGLAPAKHQ